MCESGVCTCVVSVDRGDIPDKWYAVWACCHDAVMTLCEVTDWVTNPQGPNKPLERPLQKQYLGRSEAN